MSTPRSFPDARDVPPAPRAGRAVVIGNFDGVHVGHQTVLARAVERLGVAPRAERAELTVLTFEPHPAAVLGASAPSRLTRLARKVELLGRHGVEVVVAQRFSRSFAALSPRAFVEEVLVGALGAREVAVGWDFRFGARRAGDTSTLRALGAELGFAVEIQDVVGDTRGRMSSSRAREALARGDLGEVSAVLGRPHSVEGVVVEGDRRGRTLGFPTANVAELEEVLPAFGVYAVVCDLRGSLAHEGEALACGVANVGVRPTIEGAGRPSLEVHLFDLPEARRELYGATLRVHFVERLRDERRFPGLEALKAQIADDAEAARAATAPIARPIRGPWY